MIRYCEQRIASFSPMRKRRGTRCVSWVLSLSKFVGSSSQHPTHWNWQKRDFYSDLFFVVLSWILVICDFRSFLPLIKHASMLVPSTPIAWSKAVNRLLHVLKCVQQNFLMWSILLYLCSLCISGSKDSSPTRRSQLSVFCSHGKWFQTYACVFRMWYVDGLTIRVVPSCRSFSPFSPFVTHLHSYYFEFIDIDLSVNPSVFTYSYSFILFWVHWYRFISQSFCLHIFLFIRVTILSTFFAPSILVSLAVS